jgi:hypothetical protein
MDLMLLAGAIAATATATVFLPQRQKVADKSHDPVRQRGVTS